MFLCTRRIQFDNPAEKSVCQVVQKASLNFRKKLTVISLKIIFLEKLL